MGLRRRNTGEARRVAPVLALSFVLLSVWGCVPPTSTKQQSETRLLLDTVCTVTLYDPDAAPELAAMALDLCQEYEDLLSRTREGSDVWRINHAQGQAVDVDPRTAEVIREGLAFGAFSGGLFDITVGRLSALWGFGEADPRPPADSELEAALETVDYRRVTVTGNTVRLENPQAWLDLGGIAKGYIADRMAAFLKDNGVRSALIDLGGDIATVGGKPEDGAWRIGIRNPVRDGGELLGVLRTGETSVVTSGVYERRFVVDGVAFHHILDPRSGYPVRTDVSSATVLSENAMSGDALSTILLLVGSENASDTLERATGVVGAVLLLDNGEVLQFGEVSFSLSSPSSDPPVESLPPLGQE